MFKRYEINGKEIIAKNRFSAIAGFIMQKHNQAKKTTAEVVDFGDSDADVNSQLTFVVRKDVDVQPLLRILNKKGLLIVNFKEGTENPVISQVLQPNGRKFTQKVSGNGEYKQIKIIDKSAKTLESIENIFKQIASVFEYSDSVELCNVSYEGDSVTKLTVDYDISSVELS